jgi:hypothetical protein
MDNHPIYDWQTVLLNTVSLAWGAKYSHWLLPLIPSTDRVVEWLVALMVGVSVIVLNVLKVQQVLADMRAKRRNKKQKKNLD